MKTAKGGIQNQPAPRLLIRFTGATVLLAALALPAFQCGGDGEEIPAPATPSVTPTRSTRPIRTHTRSSTPEATPAPETAIPDTAPPTPAPGSPETPGEQPPAVGLLTVVDKQHPLPAGYVPPGLVAVDGSLAAPGFSGLLLTAQANEALGTMLAAAAAEGHDIRVRSAFRSYAEQERTYAYWVSVLGEAEARRVSAEAGHSEHQLGTTADLTSADVGYDLTEAFGETPDGRWLAENAHRYGFALSYPAASEAVTGYAYEPWHYRYIGAEHASAWRASGLTLVEYLRALGG